MTPRMLSLVMLSVALVAGVSVGAAPQTNVTPARPETATAPKNIALEAASLFRLAALFLSPSRTIERTREFYVSEGLKRAGPQSWEKTDATGTLRVLEPSDVGDGAVGRVVFFPSSRVPIADPVLAALLRTATSTVLNATGGVDVGLEEETDLADGKTVLRRYFATLEGAVVTRRTIEVSWKR